VAIVVRSDVAARYGPLEESQTHFTVRDGAELPIADTQGDWLQVIDPAGRPGWLRREAVIVQP
jgi:SH3-like domain-containing protein